MPRDFVAEKVRNSRRKAVQEAAPGQHWREVWGEIFLRATNDNDRSPPHSVAATPMSELDPDGYDRPAPAWCEPAAVAEDADEERDKCRLLSTALLFLCPRDRTVLTYRFGLYGRKPMTLDETAAEMGVTRERVRQLEARAILRARRCLTDVRTSIALNR